MMMSHCGLSSDRPEAVKVLSAIINIKVRKRSKICFHHSHYLTYLANSSGHEMNGVLGHDCALYGYTGAGTTYAIMRWCRINCWN